MITKDIHALQDKRPKGI